MSYQKLTIVGVIPEIKREYEARIKVEVEKALRESSGLVSGAARKLGCQRTTLMMYLRTKAPDLWNLADSLKFAAHNGRQE